MNGVLKRDLTMVEIRPRYICLPEGDGCGTVWDVALYMPASLGGLALVCRPLYRAEAACSVLNQIHASNFERRPPFLRSYSRNPKGGLVQLVAR